MKRIFTLVACTLVLLGSRAMSQTTVTGSFTQTHDTVYLNATGSGNLLDSITNTTSSSITLEWKVIASDFPSDWLGVTGICDNKYCYPNTTLWPSSGPAPLETSFPYSPGLMDLHLQYDFTSVGTGCHFIRVRLNNKYATNDSAIVTFKVCRVPTRISTPIVSDEVQIYPNPATTELNVVFDANADVRNIAVYNLIGKVMSVYHVNGNSANISLENIPSGIYFLRLMNSNGQVVNTKKFTKQ